MAKETLIMKNSALSENIKISSLIHVISTTLKAGLEVLPVLLILGLREYSHQCYTTFCGSTPTKVL